MTSIDLRSRQVRDGLPPYAGFASVAGRPWAGLAAGVLVVLLTMAFIDGPAARLVASLPPAFALHVGAVTGLAKGSYLMLLGVAWAVVCLIGFLTCKGSARRMLGEGALAAGFVVLTTIVALVCATILKVLIGRARPELMMIYGPHAFFPFSTSQPLTSFPSGETSMVVAFFGACAALAHRRSNRIAAILLLIPAAIVAGSRPVVGAHYVSDVLAAVMLATLVVMGMRAWWDRHHARLSERMSRL